MTGSRNNLLFEWCRIDSVQALEVLDAHLKTPPDNVVPIPKE